MRCCTHAHSRRVFIRTVLARVEFLMFRIAEWLLVTAHAIVQQENDVTV